MKKLSLSTLAIHGDQHTPQNQPVVFPIHQTSTFEFEKSSVLEDINRGDTSKYIYSRYSNPSIDEVRKKIALISDAEDALLFSSGMAAISTVLLTFAKTGNNIVSTPKLYGGTYRLMRDVLTRQGITTRYCREDLDDLSSHIDASTGIVYVETPTNPTVALINIEKLVAIVREKEKVLGEKIVIVIDNTFATIVNQKPFSFGVDISIESATKYLGGHSDVVGGIVAAPREYISRIHHQQKYYGGCLDPFAAFLLSRSLKTFELRVLRQNESAMTFAKHFEHHLKLRNVHYPGLASHKDHALAKKQMRGFGGMMAIELKANREQTMQCVDQLRVMKNAASLGGVESLVSMPVLTSHVNMSPEELHRAGVSESMIRISIGIEAVEDLIDDFERALSVVKM